MDTVESLQYRGDQSAVTTVVYAEVAGREESQLASHRFRAAADWADFRLWVPATSRKAIVGQYAAALHAITGVQPQDPDQCP